MPTGWDNGGVSDPQNLPQPLEPERDPEPGAAPQADAAAEADAEPPRRVERIEIDEPIETELTDDVVTVRRAPRYGRFITLGALLGAVVALILTFAFSGQPVEGTVSPGFDKGQVFGFLLLGCAAIGATLGAVVALVIDRASAKRARSVTALHESTHRADD